MGAGKFNATEVRKWKTWREDDGSHWFIDPACRGAGGLGIRGCTCVRANDPRLNETPLADEVDGQIAASRYFRSLPRAKYTAPVGTCTEDLVDNNPKTRQGALKAPMHLVPPSAMFHLAEALADGAAKYGAYNWRVEPITTSVYIGAIQRHMMAFLDGEDKADDSGVHHLAHVMACCALVLDSESLGILQDDRPPKGASPELMAAYHRRKTEGGSS